MKTVFALCVYALVMAHCVARAQSYPCTDPTQVAVGSFHVQTSIEGQGTNVWVDWDVTVNRNPEGEYAFKVDPASIQFSGDGRAVDGSSTFSLFESMSRATAQRGVVLGYPPCPVLCDQPIMIRVLTPGCVDRTGSGLSTKFAACEDVGCCTRQYSVCCPTGQSSPIITFISAEGPVCPLGPCASTCY